MRNRIQSAFAFVLLAVTLASVPLTPGCVKLDPAGVYQGDNFLFHSEQAIVSGKAFLDVVVKWEYDNRKLLSVRPGVTKSVDEIRAKAPEWFATAHRLRDAYAANPTPETKKALQAALDVINQAVKESLVYFTKYGPQN